MVVSHLPSSENMDRALLTRSIKTLLPLKDGLFCIGFREEEHPVHGGPCRETGGLVTRQKREEETEVKSP